MTDDVPQPYTDEGPLNDGTAVLRLLFELRDGQYEVTDVQQVVKRIPPSASLEERGDVAGAWLEVRDADGAPVFRHDLAPSLLDGAEIFPEDPRGEIIRSSNRADTMAFSVLAPLPDAADRVVLLGARTGNAGDAAREITGIDVGELRRRAHG